MEIMKMPSREKERDASGQLEIKEMNKNIVQRARLIMDFNNKLTPKILRTDWNKNLKENMLEELRECRLETKRTVENFATLSALQRNSADGHDFDMAA